MALVEEPDFNSMQQSHGLFAIAKLLVLKVNDKQFTLTTKNLCISPLRHPTNVRLPY